MPQTFDRAAEDLGNSIHFEHVNVTIPDQILATMFYVTGLGLTRDPLPDGNPTTICGSTSGRSQFHLPAAKPQVLRGHVGIVITGREPCWRDWLSWPRKLADTQFQFSEHNDYGRSHLPMGATACAAMNRTCNGLGESRSASLRGIRRAVGTARGHCGVLSGKWSGIRPKSSMVRHGGTRQGRPGSVIFSSGETDRPLPEFRTSIMYRSISRISPDHIAS